MALHMRWLGTACFEMVWPGGATVVTDPYVDDAVRAPIRSDGFEGCDMIFITHGHFDHVLDAGKLAARFSPKIYCSREAKAALSEHLQVDPSLIRPVSAGDVVREGGFTCEVVPGVHVDFVKEFKRLTGRDPFEDTSDLRTVIRNTLMTMLGTDRVPDQLEDWMAKFPKGEQLNFVFQEAGAPRVYLAGSYPDPEVLEVASKVHADITLLQVLPGRTLRGLEAQVAELAFASGCRIAVPQHHDPLLPGAEETDLSELKRIMSERPGVQLLELEPGRWYDF
ncbi:MAG: MBL fold metallo-hydrolase [Deltaproteobacteria bacterium]|nr:MBL fold metallo-hydrolase [Deltaproteobacteria bacterium]MBW1924552.1 MBL fold metallo-hydrolase [Deltaproteobacteria bacterium]MBW1947982.1 MBL fold metallo-hydrolase [Deltaproteobacteria bacterium]MBW2101662.1 MBL fold metallo-hydrolase [Deltaproteobacteria bacterium]MBW2347095.1 MBL fold metallo-hydrolase [Deltaproteobacteria bacterium]